MEGQAPDVPFSDDKLVEMYLGWIYTDVPTVFTLSAVFDDSYFIAVDSTLMFLSKGGISFADLQKMGPRTKDKYLTRLSELHKKAYGGGSKDTNNDAPPPMV